VKSVELGHGIGGMDIKVWDPLVLTSVVPFPFDEVFEAAPSYATVQYLFNFKFFSAGYKDGWWWGNIASTLYWVLWGWCQFDDGEDWVKTTE
jgi:hypothetical protein